MKKPLVILSLALALPVLAQESMSYRLTEHAFNAGAHPTTGVALTSTGQNWWPQCAILPGPGE